ncbi:uroporphyrinogen-III C-methyltransferase [Candidatus Colwellia aromaticivorans]|uniref:uroporphyrinogen-III C-methyltransferase n=1 Tax=Candidatus Colwellia aromaticivorans TaxID=2267621 RepID=UPI0014448E7F|nr:uroporphyrinogen-III C-methyltransferase [Candidatus Colwellia aromaticivorans]
MTDKKTPLATEPEKNIDTKAPVTKTTKATETKVSAKETTASSQDKVPTKETTAGGKTKVPTKKATASSKNKVSKLALVAIVIALGSTAGHYFWQQQQSQLLTAELSQQIDHQNTATANQYQTLIKQQEAFAKQLQQVTTQVNGSNQAKIRELNTTVSQLEQKMKQRQPSDWLLHEAEYLIRIAARTLWLEHDTTAAVGLLKDADARLADLNDPAFLPVRQLVHQDMKSLELMPTLQTDEIVLTLMAMNKQVAILPLAMVDIGAKSDKNTNLELSNDVNDWQANLAKTWKKFLDDFIRVRQRTGMIKPLVSPEQQQHLRQNLNLKIQLALWAASERKGDIYQQALTDVQEWITEFFDLGDATNQHFLQSLTNLQTKLVSYDYPSELTSLKAIRTALKNQPMKSKTADDTEKASPVKQSGAVEPQPVILPTKPQASPSNTADDAEKSPQNKQSDAVTTEPQKSSPLPKQQDDQPNVEGII